jgi:ketosteroid isomerase-like protein
MHRKVFALIAASVLMTVASAGAKQKPDLRAQVFAAESSFAHTLAARDLETFGSFVAKDAIFFGGRGVLHGRAEVVAGWKPLFEGPDPPFSWKPEVVEVLESGTLAHSSGPVMDPSGKVFGMFQSVWRLDSDGKWRVVFDKGCPVCDSTRTQ